jgi:hypothetical protein
MVIVMVIHCLSDVRVAWQYNWSKVLVLYNIEKKVMDVDCEVLT